MKRFASSNHATLLLTLCLAIAPYFLALGASSLWDSNEAFYAETPRQMIETGDYISPRFNGQPRFNKPPLSYWVVACSYHLFGVSETAERLPIALAAVVMIVAAFIIGRALYSTSAGLYAAIGLAIAPRFLMFSRRIMIDVWVAMWMALVLMFFILAEQRRERRRRYLVLMYVAIGLGVLTKGPVALVLPALAFLFYLMASRRLGDARWMMIPLGTVIITLIVLPWYTAVYWRHGFDSIAGFLLRDNLSRYTQPVWGPRRGLWFYLPVMLGDLFPWSVFWLTAIWIGVKRLFASAAEAKEGDDDNFSSASDEAAKVQRPPSPVARAFAALWRSDSHWRLLSGEGVSLRALPVIWVAVIVIFFSLSSNKEDLYILPSYPAAAVIIGGLLARLIGELVNAALRRMAMLLAVVMALLGLLIIYLFNRTAIPALAGATTIGTVVLVGGLVALGLLILRQPFPAILATALAMIAGNMVFVLYTLPDFERYKPARAVSTAIKERAAPDALVGYYRLAAPSLTFYLHRPVFEYYRLEELQAAFASGKEVYCLLTEADYLAIKEALPPPISILATRPMFQVKWRTLFASADAPRALLISNRT